MAGNTAPMKTAPMKTGSEPIRSLRSYNRVLRPLCRGTYNPSRMRIALSIADLLVLLAVVFGALRAVRNGRSRGPGSLLLSICITLALLIFALVSFTAASGLAESSSLNQVVLLAFLVVTAVVARVSWVNQP